MNNLLDKFFSLIAAQSKNFIIGVLVGAVVLWIIAIFAEKVGGVIVSMLAVTVAAFAANAITEEGDNCDPLNIVATIAGGAVIWITASV